MNLDGIVSDLYVWGKHNRQFLTAASIFSIATASDVALTIFGVSNGYSREANPIIKFSMEHIGTELGVSIPKILGSAAVIYGARRINSTRLLYFGAAAYFSFSALWLAAIVSYPNH